jgi:hypothetical protein
MSMEAMEEARDQVEDTVRSECSGIGDEYEGEKAARSAGNVPQYKQCFCYLLK